MLTKSKSLFASIGLILLAAGCSKSGSQAVRLTGAGATFPFPIYSKWFEAYRQKEPDAEINYQAIGSGGGQQQITAGTVDFGASDGPMSDEALAKAPAKLLHIPTVAGGVGLSYNLTGVDDLKLDGATIANIFLGKITKWNDPAIAAQNAGVNLPDAAIAPVHRADGSGTTFIFTDYLSTISPDWKSAVGKATSVSWPKDIGIGSKGSDGVAGTIKQTAGAVGYVELTYAVQNKLPLAELKNAEGVYLKPTLDSVTAALATATIPDDFRFSMVNAPGKDSYPIAGVTWLLVYEQQKDPAKGKVLVDFLKWALNDGEKMAKSLDYAPLPDSLREKVLTRINTIKY